MRPRLIKESDLPLLNSLGFSNFPPSVTDGQWKMTAPHVASLTFKLPPVRLFKLPALDSLSEALKNAGLLHSFKEGVADHHGIFRIVRLEVSGIEQQCFEQNKNDLIAAFTEYGEATASQIRKATHNKFVNKENKPGEFFER